MNKLLITLTFVLAVFSVSAATADDDIFLGEDHEPGFIKIRDNGDDLFYWLMRSRGNKETDPLVFWLSGGPGCSSELAVFYENGPFHINEQNLTLTKNSNSWNEHANMVYMDQPVGTGYSHAETPIDWDTNEEEISKDFYTFLVRFMERHPEYKKRSIFITGESYAGHYIPAISAYIVSQKNADIVLVGSAIGNGLVDPYHQYPAYAEFAYENKLIGEASYEIVKAAMVVCQGLIKTGVWPVALEECQLGLTPIIGVPVAPAFNLYDIREKCSHPPLCYDFEPMDKFLAQDKVKTALNVTGRKFEDCNMKVHTALLGDWMLSLQDRVTYLLENKVHVLVYSGDKDFICNWRGGEAWTNEANWTHSADFKNASYQNWTMEGNAKPVGEFKEVAELTFLRVFDAGHMVPMDQPEVALGMLDRFFGTWHTERMNKIKEGEKQDREVIEEFFSKFK